jgi:hypothetical protein
MLGTSKLRHGRVSIFILQQHIPSTAASTYVDSSRCLFAFLFSGAAWLFVS